MDSLVCPSSCFALSICQPYSSLNHFSVLFSAKPKTSPRKYHEMKIKSSMLGSFHDLEPTLVMKPEPIDCDVSWINPVSRAFDLIIIGAGPAGLRLAEEVSQRGIRVCCIDPSPHSMWPNNYGVWVDEFQGLGLEDCLDKVWPTASVYLDDHSTKLIHRAYGRVNRRKLKHKLLNGCVSNDVKFHKAKVLKIKHGEKCFESLVFCSDGAELKASLVVDASGFTSDFIEYDKPRSHGFQVALGILAEVDSHPFDLDQVVLMDWRNSHHQQNSNINPTFLYAMPISSNMIFLEETCLVSRPSMSYAEINARMVERLMHLGIRVKSVVETEKGMIPMGGPLPKIPQNVVAFGGNSGMVHPSTGYMLARAMAATPVLADEIVACLGSDGTVFGASLHQRVWKSLWPVESRCMREFYSFGMETLLTLDVDQTRRFFDAFFSVDPVYMEGFLSSTLSPPQLAVLCMSLFWHSSNRSRLDMAIKCPAPLLRMMGNMALQLF